MWRGFGKKWITRVRSLYMLCQECVNGLAGTSGPKCNYQILNIYMLSFGLDATENTKFKKK